MVYDRIWCFYVFTIVSITYSPPQQRKWIACFKPSSPVSASCRAFIREVFFFLAFILFVYLKAGNQIECV